MFTGTRSILSARRVRKDVKRLFFYCCRGGSASEMKKTEITSTVVRPLPSSRMRHAQTIQYYLFHATSQVSYSYDNVIGKCKNVRTLVRFCCERQLNGARLPLALLRVFIWQTLDNMKNEFLSRRTRKRELHFFEIHIFAFQQLILPTL